MEGQGRIKLLRWDRESPVWGSRVPPLGSLMNSGQVEVVPYAGSCGACKGSVVKDICDIGGKFKPPIDTP